ncbi:MAG TPA: DUF3313 family protein [Croceibacterium sp.]|nr:DUF3313 family protein [Croceibacterium sp.]
MIARLAMAAALAALPYPALATVQIDFTPGATPKSYRKILVAPAEVEFDQRFVKDGKLLRGNRGHLREQDAQQIASEIGQSMRNALADAFRKRGFEVVAAPASDVLMISPAVRNLYVNTPSDRVGSRVFARSAGEARMVVEGSDFGGARVLRASNKGIAGETAGFLEESKATNLQSFDEMFRDWADELASAVAAGK